MRKTYFDNLPRRKIVGREFIDWENSNNCMVKFIYDDIEGMIKIINYNKNNNHIFFEYDNSVYELNKQGLVECRLSVILKAHNKKSTYNIGDEIKDLKRNLLITDVNYAILKNDEGKRIWYKYTCLKCGWTDGLISESDLVSDKGCSCCKGFTVVEGINDIPTTAPWMIPYFQGGYDEAKLYTYQTSKRIYPICPDCGTIKDKSKTINKIYSNKSIGCICGDGISYPEKFIFSLLSQLEIKFIRQFSKVNIKWCEKYLYDFMISNIDCIIETNGMQHYHNANGNWNSLDEIQKTDEIKELIAYQNNIKHYIVLDCRKSELKWIKKSVLESELPALFNFTENSIDWNECERFATSNIVKKVCEYKKQNQSKTVKDISNIFNLSNSAIKSYLRRGNKLGWCK